MKRIIIFALLTVVVFYGIFAFPAFVDMKEYWWAVPTEILLCMGCIFGFATTAALIQIGSYDDD